MEFFSLKAVPFPKNQISRIPKGTTSISIRMPKPSSPTRLFRPNMPKTWPLLLSLFRRNRSQKRRSPAWNLPASEKNRLQTLPGKYGIVPPSGMEKPAPKPQFCSQRHASFSGTVCRGPFRGNGKRRCVSERALSSERRRNPLVARICV